MFGPLDSAGALKAIVRSLTQAAIVFSLGALLVLLARRRPDLAGAAAVIIMTADLAAANARYVLTVPQSLFESKPEVQKIIEAAERGKPRPGPFRVHHMPLWSPLGWPSSSSKDRVFELASWEHNTLQPKFGINHGIEYTHTVGALELYDYEWYFIRLHRPVRDPDLARSLGVAMEKEVLYFPRRAFDMWNTRYLVVPYWHGDWRDELRATAAFVFETERVYPEAERFQDPNGGQALERDWIQTNDFKVLRNLAEYPRAWVVHNARMTPPVKGLSSDTRSEAFQEILHAGDRLWNDPTQRVYDPRRIAWVSNDDMTALRPYLSSEKTRSSENVTVSYPDPQHAVLELALDSPGLVVLADVFYPGWELTIDGNPSPVYRVNGAMRGAAVSKGPHRLVYSYNPESFRIGRLVSIAGLAAFLILGLAFTRWPVEPTLGAVRTEILPA